MPSTAATPTPAAGASGKAGGGIDSPEGGAATPDRPPLPKRRRKVKPMFDQDKEIPAAEYNNISKITRRNVVDYTLFLPHKSPEVGLTTIFSDLCVELCEPFLRAAQVG